MIYLMAALSRNKSCHHSRERLRDSEIKIPRIDPPYRSLGRRGPLNSTPLGTTQSPSLTTPCALIGWKTCRPGHQDDEDVHDAHTRSLCGVVPPTPTTKFYSNEACANSDGQFCTFPHDRPDCTHLPFKQFSFANPQFGGCSRQYG